MNSILVFVLLVLSCVSAENLFDQQISQEKETSDICSLPMEKGPCKARFIKWFYNETGCEMFEYGGCRGNENKFDSLEDCVMRCVMPIPVETSICDLPVEVGPCKAKFPRYYYNPLNQMCESFEYGGCRGNDNNFMELTDCQGQCGK